MTNVIDLIDHVIDEGDRLFAGTPYAATWVIHHDALGQWWTAAAQAHVASRGMQDRQVCIPGARKTGSYDGKLVGNSPELMPLDSNLFADFVCAIKQHVALTAEYANDDPRKFNLGSPNNTWDAMVQTWNGDNELSAHPTSARIVHDVFRLPASVDRIIAAKGVVVPDLDNRKGARATVNFIHHADCNAAVAARDKKYSDWLRDGGVVMADGD